jgi:hypothetical protein
MEWPLGQGWVLACSRPLLEALTEEPPAASLLSALVRYAATLSAAPFARKPVVALADPQGDAARWLHELDVTAATRLPLGTPSAVVIVDAKSVPQETLRAMTQRTDARTVVLLGLDPASLAALEPLCPAGLRLESEAHDIGSGLGPAPPPETKSSTSSDPLWWGITDRMLRCAVADGRVYRLRPLEETSGRFLEGGLGGLWEKEGRRVVGWQAPLNNPWGRAAFCQLLTNLGAELPNE